MADYGRVQPGSTLPLFFDAFAGSSGAPTTISGLATTDVKVYKDGSTAERASQAGYTLLDSDGINFDSIVGICGISIDTADNTVAGFWVAGSRYNVVVDSIQVDGQTLSFNLGSFYLGFQDAIRDTYIATLSSQTVFTLAAGSGDDNAYNGCLVVIQAIGSGTRLCFGRISSYTGSTRTVGLDASPGIFTIAAGDNISILPPTYVSDKTGFSLSSGGVQAIWGSLTSGLTLVGSIGELLVAALDAPISSRSSHSVADIVAAVWANATRTLTAIADSAGVTTLLGRLTEPRADALDDVAATSARLDGMLEDNIGGDQWSAYAMGQAPGGSGATPNTIVVTPEISTRRTGTLTYGVDSTLPIRRETIIDATGDRVPLGGCTGVVYQLTLASGGSTPKVQAAGDIHDAVGGVVEYIWAAGDLDTPGTYRERWVLTFDSGDLVGDMIVLGPLIEVA